MHINNVFAVEDTVELEIPVTLAQHLGVLRESLKEEVPGLDRVQDGELLQMAFESCVTLPAPKMLLALAVVSLASKRATDDNTASS